MNKCEEIKKEKTKLLENDLNSNEIIDLDEITKGYKIFTNIDSLRHEESFEFYSKLTNSLVKNNNKLFIPLKGIRIMEDNSDSLDIEEGLGWKKGLDILKNIQENGALEVRGEETDGHLDNLIQYVFAKHRISNNLILITQNENLAYDILELNKSRTVRGNKIEVYKINEKGNAERFETNS